MQFKELIIEKKKRKSKGIGKSPKGHMKQQSKIQTHWAKIKEYTKLRKRHR